MGFFINRCGLSDVVQEMLSQNASCASDLSDDLSAGSSA